ncbi:PREDICTED: bcl-2-like protein 13 [Poecilia mexicana]|nr:PREDICTED: bcl-2-like protein 13 [Poecilia mexicana]
MTEETQPAFILEGKVPVEPNRGDGGSSPASLPLTPAETSGPWHSESLLAESWSTMGDMDPEDSKSLDSNDGPVLAGDENHSSNSDMVHLEREEAEMLEETEGRRWRDEDEELQASILSMLSVERELAEPDLQAPEAKELLVSAEEPHAEFRHVVPPMALPLLPILKLDPPSTTTTPVPSTTASEVEEQYSTLGLHPPSILSPKAPELQTEESPEAKFSQIPLQDDGEHSVKAAAAPKTKSLSSSELLFGGAALVAVVGVVAYGAIVYCKK